MSRPDFRGFENQTVNQKDEIENKQNESKRKENQSKNRKTL